MKGTEVPEGALKRPLPLDPEDQIGGALVLLRRGRRPLAVVTGHASSPLRGTGGLRLVLPANAQECL